MRPAAAFARTLFAVALLVLSACEAPPRPSPIALRIGVYAAQDYLPYFVMQERGIARKHGISFTEVPVAGGAAAIEAMAAGTMDVSMAGFVPLLMAAEKGAIPEKVVAIAVNNFADATHRGAGVLVADSVRGWKDLEGGKIGTNAFNSVLTAAAGARLEQENVRGYAFVEIPLPNLGLALAGGNVAAASMNEPYLTQSLLRGDGKLLGWVIGGPPFERTEFTAILAATDFHRRSPQAVKTFLRAHLEAVRWINEHPGEARGVLARRLNLSVEVSKAMNLLRWPADARSDPALLEQTMQALLKARFLKRPADTRAAYDETLLAEVLKEKR